MRVIITNNKIALEKARGRCIAVEGDTEDVLIKVRDLVHSGYTLLSYPLGASIKMLHSPVTSVLMEEGKAFHEESALIAEESLEKLRNTLGERKADERNRPDYETIDWDRLQSAIDELNRF